MRKILPAAAILAGAALTLGACNNPNDDAAATNDYATDSAATMPADNTMVDTNVMTNTDTNTVDTNTAVNTTTNTTTY